MRISEIYLKGYKRIFNGLGKKEVTIEIPSSRVVRIIGTNGSGKSTLMRYLTPLTDGPYEIIDGEDGEKIIYIEDLTDYYVIDYKYKAAMVNGKQTHNSSCSIKRNGEELNINGNISSGKDLIMNMFGMDNNFDVLSRLTAYDGRSLANMRPADRKKFISALLNNLNVYNNIYKTLSKRSSVFRSVINSLGEKIGRIGNPESITMAYTNSENNLKELNKRRDEIIGMMNNSSIDELKSKKSDLDYDLNKLNSRILELIDKLDKARNVKYCAKEICNGIGDINDTIEHYEELNTQYTREIGECNEKIKNLEIEIENDHTKISTISSKINVQEKSYNNLIESKQLLEKYITELDKFNDVKEFTSSIDFDEVNAIVKRMDELKSIFNFKTIDNTILDDTGNINRNKIYNEIGKALDNINSNRKDSITIINHIIQNLLDYIDNKETISEFTIMNNKLKDRLKENYKYIEENRDYDKLKNIVYDLHNAYDEFSYVSIIKNNMEAIEDKLQILEEANVESTYLNLKKELNECTSQITKNKSDLTNAISKKENDIDVISDIEEKLEVLNKAKEASIYYETYSKELKDSQNIMSELLMNKDELDSVISKWDSISNELEQINLSIKQEENNMYSYKHSLDVLNDYMREMSDYNNKFTKIEILKKYSSPSTGIQVAFIELYMNKILSMANQLLSSLFDGQFVINKFEVNENEFRIPVQGNGLPIDDISSLSASQLAMANMCISFALLHHSSTKFKILRLDEIDSSLDQLNRLAYPNIINTIMDMMNSEQCFVISHNIEFDNSECGIIDLNKL